VGIGVLLLFWSAMIEPQLIDDEEEVAEIPGLPAAWLRKHIALIADF